MVAHPILINRPFVVAPVGVCLCRPSELVLDILPLPQTGIFTKEDGEAVIDTQGNRVSNKYLDAIVMPCLGLPCPMPATEAVAYSSALRVFVHKLGSIFYFT